jgi:hypothetical protein
MVWFWDLRALDSRREPHEQLVSSLSRKPRRYKLENIGAGMRRRTAEIICETTASGKQKPRASMVPAQAAGLGA